MDKAYRAMKLQRIKHGASATRAMFHTRPHRRARFVPNRELAMPSVVVIAVAAALTKTEIFGVIFL